MTRRACAFAGIVLATALGGCGSTNNGGTTTNASSQLPLSECMRSHGVRNFPDPNAGGGFSITGAPGSSTLTIDGTPFSGPVFEAAVKACKLFGGGTAPPPLSAAQKKQALAFAHCMRTDGEPGFPDPTFPAGGGIAIRVPSTVMTSSPAFRQARQDCGSLR